MFHLWEKWRSMPERRLKMIGLVAFMWLLVCVFLCIAGYWGVNYYAGKGKAVAYKLIPAPSDSEVVSTNVFDDYAYYRNEVVLYTSDTPLLELRDWFSQYMSMSPIEGTPTGQEPFYVSLGVFIDPGNEYSLVALSVYLTGVDHPWYETNPDCFRVFVASPAEFLQTRSYTEYFPALDAEALEGKNAIFVQRCWPHNEG